MSLQEKKKEKRGDLFQEKKGKRRRNPYRLLIPLLVSIIILIFAAFLYIEFTQEVDPEEDTYEYESMISGIPIKSKVPLEELRGWEYLALVNSSEQGIINCNYEIAAVSTLDQLGRVIEVGYGKTGVYIGKDSAWIRGMNSREIMSSCHAFVCLLEDIECKEDFDQIQKAVVEMDPINLVIDPGLGGKAIQQGVIELSYGLGAVQALTNVEISTYLMEGNLCHLITTLKSSGFAELGMNKSISCDEIEGIYLLKAEQSEIRLEGDNLILAGDDDAVYAESIIVQNIIAPNLRERMEKLNIRF